MKKTISSWDFVKAFRDYDRDKNFSNEGLHTLFDYFEQLEEDCGYEMELDVIAICCDWTEYNNDELIFDYSYLLSFENWLEDTFDTESDETYKDIDYCKFQYTDMYIDALIEKLEYYTIVVPVRDFNGNIKSFLVEAF